MPTGVILSIRPQFASLIFSGQKQYEFRKTIFKNKNVKDIYVYESKPTSMVVGFFEIDEVISASPEALWEITKQAAGVGKRFFDSYFSGRDKAFAIKVGRTTRFIDPSPLTDLFGIRYPPQSFMYI